jgi:hypothetical protein
MAAIATQKQRSVSTASLPLKLHTISISFAHFSEAHFSIVRSYKQRKQRIVWVLRVGVRSVISFPRGRDFNNSSHCFTRLATLPYHFIYFHCLPPHSIDWYIRLDGFGMAEGFHFVGGLLHGRQTLLKRWMAVFVLMVCVLSPTASA